VETRGLGFVGQLVQHVPHLEVVEEAHELAEEDVGHAGVAPDDQHVFVVVDRRRVA
jgi:hypothetical protein